jgi:hypothetical protein
MLSIEYSEAISETLDILNHTRKEDIDKIPLKFMEFLKENASKTYRPELDHTQNIKDMQLKVKTKAILAIIYRNFWCDSEQQKEFDNILKNNEIQYQKELREKYYSNNSTKGKSIDDVASVKEASDNIKITEYKETVFTKIQNWIRKLFKK